VGGQERLTAGLTGSLLDSFALSILGFVISIDFRRLDTCEIYLDETSVSPQEISVGTEAFDEDCRREEGDSKSDQRRRIGAQSVKSDVAERLAKLDPLTKP
jgi:hypothetical protein